MKRIRSAVLLCAGLTVVTALMALKAEAQSEPMKTHIPFSFYAGDAALPSSTYTVTMRGDMIRISDGYGHATTVLCNPTRNRRLVADTSLVFKGSGTKWFLTEVRWQDHDDTREVIQPRSVELELSK